MPPFSDNRTSATSGHNNSASIAPARKPINTKNIEPPSLEKAMQAKLLAHPSRPLYANSSTRELMPLCIPTGRYVTKYCCGWFDPFCEGRKSSFVPYGSGITTYFKIIKLLIVTFLIMAIVNLPNLLINLTGSSHDKLVATAVFTKTSLANIAVVNGTSGIDIGWVSDRFTAADVAFLYGICDLVACLVFAISFLWLKKMQNKEERQVDRDTLSADDYTIWMTNIPKNTTEKEIIHYFKHIASIVSEQANSPALADVFEIADIHLVEDNMDCTAVFLERGKVVRRIERLTERLRQLELRNQRQDDTWCGGPNYERRINKVMDEIRRLRAEELRLTKRASVRAPQGVVSAFVTFEKMEGADNVVSLFSGGFVSRMCQPRKLWFRGTPVSITQAPAPSNIIWKNLPISKSSQCGRQMFTGFLTVVLLAISFVLLWFASYQQREFSVESSTAVCAEPWMIDLLDNGVVDDVTVFDYDPEADEVTCFCARLNVMDYHRISDIASSPFVEICSRFLCPRWFSLDSTSIFTEPQCGDWFTKRVTTIAFSIGASLVILIINSLLAMAMRALTALEGHYSYDGLNSSLALRLFFAQFFNTALLMLLINAAWPESVRVKFATGKHEDFTPAWFDTVGASLITTMLINIVTPHIYPWTMAFFYWYRTRGKGRYLDRESQRDLDEQMIGPYADYSLRYAQLFNILFVTFCFASGLPIMLFIAVSSFIGSYWSDKILFLRYFRLPPRFNANIQKIMSNLMPLALIIHLGFGVWQYSNTTYFEDAYDPFGLARKIRDSNVYDRFGNAVLDVGFGRITAGQALPLLLFFAVIVVLVVGRFLFSTFITVVKNIFHILTCGLFKKVRINWDDEDDEAFYAPTYSKAVENCGNSLLQHKALTGLQTYNILENPEIVSAFAIDPDFAKKHKGLSALVFLTTNSIRRGSSHDGTGDGNDTHPGTHVGINVRPSHVYHSSNNNNSNSSSSASTSNHPYPVPPTPTTSVQPDAGIEMTPYPSSTAPLTRAPATHSHTPGVHTTSSNPIYSSLYPTLTPPMHTSNHNTAAGRLTHLMGPPPASAPLPPSTQGGHVSYPPRNTGDNRGGGGGGSSGPTVSHSYV